MDSEDTRLPRTDPGLEVPAQQSRYLERLSRELSLIDLNLKLSELFSATSEVVVVEREIAAGRQPILPTFETVP